MVGFLLVRLSEKGEKEIGKNRDMTLTMTLTLNMHPHRVLIGCIGSNRVYAGRDVFAW